jgi:hypothetical protein
MFHLTTVPGWRARSALAATLLGVIAMGGHAAVLPLADDPLAQGSMRAGLLTAPMAALAGQWVGRTASGRVVSLVLRVDRGAVAGDATLDGVVANAKAGPRPLVTPTMSGRTMAFAVQPGPCAKALTRGIVTFESGASAQLDLHAGPTPISIRLSKVG